LAVALREYLDARRPELRMAATVPLVRGVKAGTTTKRRR